MPTEQPILSKRLEGKRICICAGAGGVGKTTISAALALGLASEGKRVAVLSIDPARRLAGALGLRELPAEPRLIESDLLAAQGIQMRGELWAMMLDSKRTFDQLIARLAGDRKVAEEIYANRIYREISSAVAGSQEFTAVAKLYELDREGNFDVIVLDTPPSRNALDFLDAPTRLTQFLDGRALSVFMTPGGVAARVLGAGSGLVFAAFARVSGIDLLGELSGFFRSLAGVLDGFRERVRGVGELLRDPGTAFLIVTSPESDPVNEALFVHRKLAEAGMPYGALIVNLIHEGGLRGQTVQELAGLLTAQLGDRLAVRAAENLRDFDVLVRRDRDSVQRLCRSFGDTQPILVPCLDRDIGDLQSLAVIADHLLGEIGSSN
jgi:anion-transporting  ArsA/GET3 family ATPase